MKWLALFALLVLLAAVYADNGGQTGSGGSSESGTDSTAVDSTSITPDGTKEDDVSIPAVAHTRCHATRIAFCCHT